MEYFVTEGLWQLLLTFPRHLHDDAASWGPQVHSAATCAHSQAWLAGIPLEILDRAQLLQHHRQLQLADVPDPHGVGNVICRGSSNGDSLGDKRITLGFSKCTGTSKFVQHKSLGTAQSWRHLSFAKQSLQEIFSLGNVAPPQKKK